MKFQTITAEMVIGVQRQCGLGALGKYQVHDIGKRVYGNQVENEDQVMRRTGLSFADRKVMGIQAIRAAKKKYRGQKNIWGLTVT